MHCFLVYALYSFVLTCDTIYLHKTISNTVPHNYVVL